MIEKVITGGQTGADQAGWRAAKRFGIPTGGWMPLGFLTEAGFYPEFAGEFGAQESPSQSYPPRTRQNVLDSDATIFLGTRSLGFRVTCGACTELVRPFLFVEGPINTVTPKDVAFWAATDQGGRTISVLNVAGNRESRSPGIGEWVEMFMAEVFRILGHQEVTP